MSTHLSPARQDTRQSTPLTPFPWALLLRGAISWETVDGISCREVWQSVQTIIEDEQWCQIHKEDVSEILFACISGLDDTTLRRQLLQVKRKLYNLQASIDYALLARIAATRPAEQQQLLLTYASRCQSAWTMREQTTDLVVHHFARARAHLYRVIQNTPALLQGIALSSPDLYEQAHQLLVDSNQQPPDKLTKEEMSLLLYLTRMATKTSAFSTFTHIALARCIPSNDQHCILHIPEANQTGLAAINHLPLTQLTHALTAHPRLRTFLPIRLNPDCFEQNGRLVLVRIAELETGFRREVYAKAERASLGMTPTLKTIVAILRDAQTPYTFGSLIDWLVQRLPGGENVHQRAEQLLQRLLDQQIIQFACEGMQTRTLVQDLSALAAAFPPEQAGASAQALQQSLHVLAESTLAYATQAAAERVTTERNVVTALEQGFQALDAPVHPSILRLPLYEDSVLASPDITISLPATEELRQDFQVLAGIVPLFSSSSVFKAVMTSLFTQTYQCGGQCQDVLRFLLDTRQFLADDFARLAPGMMNLGVPITIPPALEQYAGDAARLIQLRTTFLDTLVNQASTQQDEVILDRTLLRQFAAEVPESLQVFQQHYAYMCQSVADTSGDSLVINAITDGWGKHLAIQSATIQEALILADKPFNIDKLLRENLAEIATDGHELVELSCGNGFNGNIHPPLTRRVLVLPGVWCDRPAEEQLHLSDLRIVHDRELNRLVLCDKRLGNEIHLLYFGLLSSALLGPLHSLLLPFTQGAYWSDTSLLEAFLKVKRQGHQDKEIVCYPRFRLGKLVLSRRKWLLPAEVWPRWESRKLPDTEQLVTLERWRTQIGLPEQVFVRPALFRRVKPQFVDFHHIPLLAALPRRLRSLDGWFKIEEALPAPASCSPDQDGQQTVSTFWLEVR